MNLEPFLHVITVKATGIEHGTTAGLKSHQTHNR